MPFFSSDSHSEDVSLLNFFLDRDIIPIEINFEQEISRSELHDIFESIKSKIGPPRTYELSKEEQEEIARLKREIAIQEAAEKAEDNRKKAAAELEVKERQIQEWVRKLFLNIGHFGSLHMNPNPRYVLRQTR